MYGPRWYNKNEPKPKNRVQLGNNIQKKNPQKTNGVNISYIIIIVNI